MGSLFRLQKYLLLLRREPFARTTFPWHFLKLDFLFRSQHAFEKADVRDARIEPFFVEDEQFHPDHLQVRLADGIRVENVVQASFLVANRSFHHLSDGIAGSTV